MTVADRIRRAHKPMFIYHRLNCALNECIKKQCIFFDDYIAVGVFTFIDFSKIILRIYRD